MSLDEKYKRKASKSLKRNGYYYTDRVFEAYEDQLITNSVMADYLAENLQVINQIRKKIYWENQ